MDCTQRNAVAVLAHGEIASLKGEDPSSWEEFAKAIASDGQT